MGPYGSGKSLPRRENQRELVSLDYRLKTGDQVEILTAKRGGPSRDWLNIHLGLVNTQRARSKIRQWFKKQDRDQNLSQGRDILDHELKRLGIVDLDIDNLSKSFDYKSSE
jgi:GTP pyrophosphokinase